MPNRSIAGYLAAFLASFILAKGIRRDDDEKRDAKSRGETAEDIKPVEKQTGHARGKTKYPTEEEHRAAEQIYWKWSGWASWVTAVAALIAVGLSFSAFRETRRQADAADEANRPWLKIDELEVRRLAIENDEITVGVGISVVNVGHSPAQSVKIKLLPPYVAGDVTDASKFVCRNIRTKREDIVSNGDVVFPQPDPTEVFAVASRPLGELKAAAKSDKPFLLISGCIEYKTAPISATTHTTTFGYTITLKPKDGALVGDNVDISKPHVWKGDELQISVFSSLIFAD